MSQPYPPRRPQPPQQGYQQRQVQQPGGYPPAPRGHRPPPPPPPPARQPGYQPVREPRPVQYVVQQAPKKRRVWPWVLLGVVLTPILGVVACTALLGGAVSAVDQARQGGTVAIGETFTYSSGLGVSVAVPTGYTPQNQFEVGDGEVAYETLITISNGTTNPVGATLITKNATLAGQPVQEVFGEGTFATQDIAPGQQLVLPFRFKTAGGATGPLQIAVTDTFNEPVFFTGRIE